MKYANQTPFTHVYNKFEYYAEDMTVPSARISKAAEVTGAVVPSANFRI